MIEIKAIKKIEENEIYKMLDNIRGAQDCIHEFMCMDDAFVKGITEHEFDILMDHLGRIEDHLYKLLGKRVDGGY